MAVNLSIEHVISLLEAVKHLPPRRGGKRPHVSTLYRWASKGLKGVRLETVQVGGTACTSLEALQRFFDRLARQARPPPGIQTLSVDRIRFEQQVERELDRLGL